MHGGIIRFTSPFGMERDKRSEILLLPVRVPRAVAGEQGNAVAVSPPIELSEQSGQLFCKRRIE